MSDAISFRGLTFTYPGALRPALRDVTLDVPQGALALVTGSTGAGKSTLLRAVNGLVPHFTGGRFEGAVVTGGRDTMSGAPRELADVVAFVPQDPGAAFVVDRVEDELAYGMENLGVAPRSMRRRVEEMLDLLGLEALRDRSVRSLSGGERQRVAIAGALTSGARVVVLDEPTSQLDPQGAEDVLAALHRMVHDLGYTVVLAEHRLERVAGFADVVVVCSEGEATIGEPRAQLRSSSGAPPVTRVGRSAGWDPAPLTVREARRSAPSLEAPRARPAARTGQRLLRTDGLVAGYGGSAVLKEVSFELDAGEVVALMGRNGSGKTTLLRCIAGLHPLERGTITGPAAEDRRIALCPQSAGSILFKDSVRAEVEATLRWADGELDPSSVLGGLGIDELADAHPRDLSAGQRSLVAIAATVAAGGQVLLLDEPTKGLDPDSKDRLRTFLGRRADTDATIVATHDVELAAEVATRVVMLAAGEVIADGPVDEVLGDSAVFAPQMTRVFGPGWLTVDQVLGALGAPEPVA